MKRAASKHPGAVALGRLGGRKKSAAKTRACRRNAIISAYRRQQKKKPLDTERSA